MHAFSAPTRTGAGQAGSTERQGRGMALWGHSSPGCEAQDRAASLAGVHSNTRTLTCAGASHDSAFRRRVTTAAPRACKQWTATRTHTDTHGPASWLASKQASRSGQHARQSSEPHQASQQLPVSIVACSKPHTQTYQQPCSQHTHTHHTGAHAQACARGNSRSSSSSSSSSQRVIITFPP
jgi:hypothetical protein